MNYISLYLVLFLLCAGSNSSTGNICGYKEDLSIDNPIYFTDQTDILLGSKELVEIYKEDGYDAALVKLKALKGKVSETYVMDEANKYRDSKEYNKAIDLINILVIAFPDSWFCFSVLADTHLDNGNKELAIKNYHASLKIEPKNTWAIEKLELIEKS